MCGIIRDKRNFEFVEVIRVMKNAMSVKAIVLDLDNTLLHTDKKLSLYTTDVLRECQNNSIKIMVATARPLRTTAPYCQMVDFDAMVVSNGARVICGYFYSQK